jgi:protease-4
MSGVGTIVSGKSGYDGTNGATLGSDTMVEQIRRVSRDASIRAVVLRIDSPGGSTVASDVIWRELMVMKEAHPERPIIVSMSDLAASGGYYIATPGDAIVAQPGTLTGSIGIFAGKFVIDGTLEKLGINSETVMSGADADIYSPFTPFNERQRGKLERSMQDFYAGFLQKVATSRKITPEAVDRLARGRVWTGAQARERGLVDRLGGLDVAVTLAKERAKIPAAEQVELVSFPARRSFYEAFNEQFGGGRIGMASLWRVLGGGDDARAVAAVTAPARLFRRGELLALMPFTFVR